MRKKNEGSGKIYLPAAWIRPRKLPPVKVRAGEIHSGLS